MSAGERWSQSMKCMKSNLICSRREAGNKAFPPICEILAATAARLSQAQLPAQITLPAGSTAVSPPACCFLGEHPSACGMASMAAGMGGFHTLPPPKLQALGPIIVTGVVL